MGETALEREIVVVGITRPDAHADLRARLSLDEAGRSALLGRLREAGVLQLLLITDEERIEATALHGLPDFAVERIRAMLSGQAGFAAETMEDRGYAITGRAAIRHLFLVAASLDVPVIGMSRGAALLSEALERSRASGMAGDMLDLLVGAAAAAAERVRQETSLSRWPERVAAAAVNVAKEIHGDLASHAGLIIGPGVAARSFAKALVVAGLGRLTVTAPASLDAEAFARAFSCHTAPFDRLEEALAGADIVVSAVGRHQHVMTLPLVERVLARRRQRPIFLLDAGEPGDIAAEVDDLESAFRYTLTDLEALAAGKNDREPLVLAAERIVDEEVEHFLRAQAERETLPPVRALRHRLEDLRESVLTEDGVLSADEATRRLVARIVEDPQDALRAAEEVPEERFNLERALRRLFQLPDIGTPRAPSRKSE